MWLELQMWRAHRGPGQLALPPQPCPSAGWGWLPLPSRCSASSSFPPLPAGGSPWDQALPLLRLRGWGSWCLRAPEVLLQVRDGESELQPGCLPLPRGVPGLLLRGSGHRFPRLLPLEVLVFLRVPWPGLSWAVFWCPLTPGVPALTNSAQRGSWVSVPGQMLAGARALRPLPRTYRVRRCSCPWPPLRGLGSAGSGSVRGSALGAGGHAPGWCGALTPELASPSLHPRDQGSLPHLRGTPRL